MRNESHTAAQEIHAGHDLPQGRAERSEEDLATTETFALGGAHGVSGIATETYRKKWLADYLGALGMASQCSKLLQMGFEHCAPQFQCIELKWVSWALVESTCLFCEQLFGQPHFDTSQLQRPKRWPVW